MSRQDLLDAASDLPPVFGVRHSHAPTCLRKKDPHSDDVGATGVALDQQHRDNYHGFLTRTRQPAIVGSDIMASRSEPELAMKTTTAVSQPEAMWLRGTGREQDESGMEQQQGWSEEQHALCGEQGERNGKPGKHALCSCEFEGMVCSSSATSSSSTPGPPSILSADTDWQCSEHGALFASTTALPAAGPALPSRRTFGYATTFAAHVHTRIHASACTHEHICTHMAHALIHSFSALSNFTRRCDSCTDCALCQGIGKDKVVLVAPCSSIDSHTACARARACISRAGIARTPCMNALTHGQTLGEDLLMAAGTSSVR